MLIHSLDTDVRLGGAGWEFSVLSMSLERILMVCLLFPPQLPQIFCILGGLRSVFMWVLTDWEQTSFSWQLTFESSPLRPLAIVRELRVDDKSLPVLSLSCARGSVPPSACRRRTVSPGNRQQINPSLQNHTVWWCFSLCSQWSTQAFL